MPPAGLEPQELLITRAPFWNANSKGRRKLLGMGPIAISEAAGAIPRTAPAELEPSPQMLPATWVPCGLASGAVSAALAGFPLLRSSRTLVARSGWKATGTPG